MDFVKITAIFGQSLFGKTTSDFMVIRKKISDYAAEGNEESHEHANSISLMEATFSILTGDQKKASELLEEISKEIEKPNMRWRRRADLYRILQLTYIMYPPLINATNCVPMNESVLVETANTLIAEVRKLKAEIEIHGQAQIEIDRLEESIISKHWDVRSSQSDYSVELDVEGLLAVSESAASLVKMHAIDKMYAIERHNFSEPLNPLTLNLMLISSNKPDLATEEDKNEPKPPTLGCSSLMDLYNECSQSFKATNAHRAQAAASQRSGAAALIFSLLDPSLPRAVIDEAEASLQLSCDLYLADGDGLSHHLAKTHLLLARSLVGRRQDYYTEGYRIGEWAKETQNIFFGNALGVMAARYGWQRWLRYHASAAAARILQIALGIFSALECNAFKAQVIFTLGDIWATGNDFHRARSHYLESFDIFTKKVFSESQEGGSLAEMQTVESEVLVNMSGRVLWCLSRLHDRGGMQTFFERFKERLTMLPSTNVTRDRLKKDEENIRTYMFQMEYRELLREDRVKEANEKLDAFLHRPLPVNADVREQTMVRVGQMNAAFSYGRPEIARFCLAEIDDRLGQFEDSKYVLKIALDAFESSVNAYDFARARKFCMRVQEFAPHYFSLEDQKRQHQNIDHLIEYALMLQDEQSWLSSLQFLALCCRLAEQHRRENDDQKARRTIFSHPDVANAFSWAIRACLELSVEDEIGSPKACDPSFIGNTWVEQALCFAENAKARFLADSLERQVKSTEKAEILSPLQGHKESDEQANHFILEAKATINDLTSSESDFFNSQVQLSDVPSLIEKINPQLVIIEISLCYEGLAVACISPKGIFYCPWNPEFGLWQARDLAGEYHTCIRSQTRALIARETSPEEAGEIQKDQDKRTQIMKRLSAILVEPFAEHIRNASHVVIIPPRHLARIPFAELMLDGQHIFLSKSIYQVPSLRTLLTLHRAAYDQAKPEVFTACTVAQPRPPESGYNQYDPELFWSAYESVVIANMLPDARNPLNGGKLDSAGFQREYETAHFIHVAAHGIEFDFDDPEKAHLRLFEPVHVLDMQTWNTRAHLVFLATCFSGTGFMTETGDLIGFSHTILGSGARAFIGSLWAASDVVTFFLVYFFCKGLKEVIEDRRNTSSLAEIFTKAQVDLAGLKQEKAQQIVDEVKEVWETCRERFDPEEVLLKRGLEILEVRREDIPGDFSNSYYWAPFIFIGYDTRENEGEYIRKRDVRQQKTMTLACF